MRICVSFSSGEIFARLDDTPTTRALMAAVPFESSASTWGEEVYFSAPVSVKLESDAREVVEPGTVCFWVQGNSLALPFGPTPASHANECRLVTRVNVLGMLEGDAQQLAAIKDGDAIRVSAA
ncbi:MAG TPA: cyclophilin-like fold protein [Burkholderiales bacterium]|nr:cyclophilin-like fold protein [Burkholderiales bacterium]